MAIARSSKIKRRQASPRVALSLPPTLRPCPFRFFLRSRMVSVFTHLHVLQQRAQRVPRAHEVIHRRLRQPSRRSHVGGNIDRRGSAEGDRAAWPDSYGCTRFVAVHRNREINETGLNRDRHRDNDERTRAREREIPKIEHILLHSLDRDLNCCSKEGPNQPGNNSTSFTATNKNILRQLFHRSAELEVHVHTYRGGGEECKSFHAVRKAATNRQTTTEGLSPPSSCKSRT